MPCTDNYANIDLMHCIFNLSVNMMHTYNIWHPFTFIFLSCCFFFSTLLEQLTHSMQCWFSSQGNSQLIPGMIYFPQGLEGQLIWGPKRPRNILIKLINTQALELLHIRPSELIASESVYSFSSGDISLQSQWNSSIWHFTHINHFIQKPVVFFFALWKYAIIILLILHIG